ncbi:hypothetical protein [Halorarum halobium]|uniref:hypothetical protein n=1 Tax=Halorarum halobium TaxID=3075121 RepID=UPI0028AFA990|nr:hypothetical protein [Halobaculum sp. XH14]
MTDDTTTFSAEAMGEVLLILATGAAMLYGLFLVVAAFSTGIVGVGVELGIAVILLVLSAQSLYTISR